MFDGFKIYVDRLRFGKVEKINENFDSSFLNVEDEDLCFNDKVRVNGSAYIAADELVININVKTQVSMLCCVCNNAVLKNVEIESFYYVESLNNIKHMVFDFRDVLRETILLEVPHFVECDNGKCRERKEIENYCCREKKKHFNQPFEKLLRR